MEYVAKFVPINFVERALSRQKLFEIASASFVNKISGTIGFLLYSCSETSVES